MIAGSELPVSAVQDGKVVGVVDRVAALKAIAGEGSVAMSALTDIDVTATPLLIEHRPWWRSRVTLSGAIVGVMIVFYLALKSEYPWPAGLTWNVLPTHLNDFQTWLVDQRNAENTSVVIRAFNGFATFLDDLVDLVHQLRSAG